MKKVLLIIVISLFAFPLFSQKKKEKKVHPYRPYEILDTRLDNMGYWKKAAQLGLTPYNPDIIPEKPVNYGSKINSKSVLFDDSPDVLVTTQNSTQSENSVFVDPNDPDHVLQSNNSTQNPVGSLYGADYLMSFNFGETWSGSIQGAGGGNSGDPAAAIGLNGRNYIGFIRSDGGQGVSYSTNNGTTWTSVLAGPTPGGSNILDKNHMWVDNSPVSPYVNTVYSSWTAFGNANDLDIEIVRSTNAGVSYSTPVNISAAVNAGSHNQGVNITTGPNGEVYVVWTIYDSWPSDEKALGFNRSLNGGATWQIPVRIIDNLKGIRNSGTGKNMRVNSFPSMTCDISSSPYRGHIYVVWCNKGTPGLNNSDGSQVWMIKSTNQGVTWSTPTKINSDPISSKQHYFPWITADPETGVLSVIWYDDRNVSSTQAEVWCANSYDGGTTWEDFRVSDVAFTPAPIPGLASSYMGDYLGISARGGKVYPVWTDNRSGVTLTYCSPYETNSLERPTNLVTSVDFETGIVQMNWNFNTVPGFQHFNIYLDDNLVGTTTSANYSYQLPEYGVFKITIKAMHNSGESLGPSATVQWGDAHISTAPDEFNLNMMPGQQLTQNIQISNTGQLPLIYTASAVTNSASKVTYCSAGGGCDEFISNVTVGTINNSSSCNGYSDYSAISTEMTAGDSYAITISNGNSYNDDQCGIWADWNNNGDFTDDPAIAVSGSPGPGPYTATITPPAGTSGSVRMRVRITWTGSVLPCGTTTYGEVEDYTIQVNSWLILTSVTGTLAPGTSAGIPVTFNTQDLAVGAYTGQVKIHSNDPLHTITTIPVNLIVGYTVYPVIEVSTASITQNVAAGLTDTNSFAIGNSGTADLIYSQEIVYSNKSVVPSSAPNTSVPVTLINETFSGGSIPAGWTVNGLGQTNWSVVNSNNAIGSPPELRMTWTPTFTGISRMVLPQLNTVDMTGLSLSFRHMVDYYAAGTTVGVAWSNDGGTTWNSAWSVTPTANIPAELKSLSIPNPDNGSGNFRICFYFSGNSYNIDYWFIDNVVLTATYNPPPPPYEWLSVNPQNGSIAPGNQSVVQLGFDPGELAVGTYQATVNISNNGLTGIKSVSVTMNVTNDYLNVLPSSREVGYHAGQVSFNLTSNHGWQIITNAWWIGLDPSSGTGNATLNVNYGENNSIQPRIASITISPSTDEPPVIVSIVQAGKPCTPGWEYEATASSHTVSIPLTAVLDIFGQPVTAGDWIGVFFSNEEGNETCGGFTQWNGTSNITVTAFGDDPTTTDKDGFVPGEFIRWKFYQCSSSGEFPAYALYDPNLPNSDGTFVPFGLSRIVSLSTSLTQTLELPANWSGVSLFINPLTAAVTSMFEPMGNDFVILFDEQNVYWPEAGLNTIGNWNSQTAYAIKMNSGRTAEFLGAPVTPVTVELTAGWHYLPVLSPCEVNVDQLFSGLSEEVMIVKDMAGSKVYWPAMGINTLGALIPGLGYQIRLNNTVSIDFPQCAGKSSYQNSSQDDTQNTPWGNYTPVPGNHLVAVPREVMSGFRNGDQIGVFTSGGILCGFMNVEDHTAPGLIAISGDDVATPELDGCLTGDKLFFKVYLTDIAKEFSLNPLFSSQLPDNQGFFVSNGLSKLDALEILTGVSDPSMLKVQVYPNPVTNNVYITGLPSGVNTVELTTTSGVKIREYVLQADGSIEISGIHDGIYYLNICSASGRRVEKLIVRN